MTYFRLNPECFLASGAKRGVIHNLYSGEAMWCDEHDARLLARCERNNPVEADREVLVKLEMMGWGYFAVEAPFVDKLRTFNAFRERRLWRETPFITTAILQISNACGVGCRDCRSAFCGICTVFEDTEQSVVPLTLAEWSCVIDDLRRFGTKHIVFTGGEAAASPDLVPLVTRACNAGIVVQVHTSGLVKLPEDLPEVAFSVLLTQEDALPIVQRTLAGRKDVSIMSCNIDAASLAARVDDKWRIMPVNRSAPRITAKNLTPTKVDRFFARKSRDHCLDGKIFIAYDGAVHPCLQHRADPIAYLRRDGLSGAVKVLVEDWWSRSVDQPTADRKCNRCEFRYCCNGCSFIDPDRSCTYEPTSGAWQGDQSASSSREGFSAA